MTFEPTKDRRIQLAEIRNFTAKVTLQGTVRRSRHHDVDAALVAKLLMAAEEVIHLAWNGNPPNLSLLLQIWSKESQPFKIQQD